MNPHATPIIAYRWLVFGAAAFYSVYMIGWSSYDQAGGPFRFLTIWALLLSFFCASRVLAFSERRTTRRWDSLIAATCVINFMVVFLFWRLYFNDPTSVTRNRELSVWWREYYLHAVGPVLMWIDAFLINRPFRRFIPALAILLAIAISYFLWAELVVSPLATSPVGTVTTGLPYPFLNDLELDGRIRFYAVNAGLAAGLLLVFFGIGWLVRMAFGDRP